MNVQPTIVTSRRRQRDLLAMWSHWSLTRILLDPATVQQVRESGWSGTHHRDDATGSQIAATEEGLGFGLDGNWRNPAEVIPWAQLTELAEEVPADERAALAEFMGRWSEHQQAYPQFRTTSPAPSCAEDVRPNWREIYDRELAAFEVSGVQPAWHAKTAALEAERSAVMAAALAPAPDAPAADLLDLLLEEDHPTPASTSSTPTETNTVNQETAVRIRNYTDHQRSALEGLRLPEQFTFHCEQKTAHSGERVVFTYTEDNRYDSVILDVDDRSRGYLDAGAAVLVARAYQRFQQQAGNQMYTDAARARSGRGADVLGGWLATHPSLEVKAWQSAVPGRSIPTDAVASNSSVAARPALLPPAPRPRSSDELQQPAADMRTGVAR